MLLFLDFFFFSFRFPPFIFSFVWVLLSAHQHVKIPSLPPFCKLLLPLQATDLVLFISKVIKNTLNFPLLLFTPQGTLFSTHHLPNCFLQTSATWLQLQSLASDFTTTRCILELSSHGMWNCYSPSPLSSFQTILISLLHRHFFCPLNQLVFPFCVLSVFYFSPPQASYIYSSYKIHVGNS